jgi:type VI secretion system protein ImpA
VAQREMAGDDAVDPDATDGDAMPEEGPAFDVRSRQQASQLLDEVGRYFRRSEPSSPIPLLIERARSLVDRDFMSILKDVLPGILKRDS